MVETRTKFSSSLLSGLLKGLTACPYALVSRLSNWFSSWSYTTILTNPIMRIKPLTRTVCEQFQIAHCLYHKPALISSYSLLNIVYEQIFQWKKNLISVLNLFCLCITLGNMSLAHFRAKPIRRQGELHWAGQKREREVQGVGMMETTPATVTCWHLPPGT